MREEAESKHEHWKYLVSRDNGERRGKGGCRGSALDTKM